MAILTFVDATAGTKIARMVPRVPTPTPRGTTMQDSDFAKLLAAAKPWMQAFLLLCRTLGLRCTEARQLTPDDYNKETNTLTFRRKQEGTSGLPLTPQLAALIRFAAETDPHAPILSTLAGHEIKRHNIDACWRRLRRRAGVPDSLVTHDMRRTVATRAYEQTHDLRIVQQILGHKALQSTLQYIGPLGTRAAVEAAIAAALPQQSLEAMPLATERTQ